MPKHYLTYAIDASGRCMHVDAVPNGIACGCTCPHCGEALVAKNEGRVKNHHFAHASGTECDGAFETTIHRLAKEVLAESKELMIPGYKYFKPQKVLFEAVEIEERNDASDIQPDIVGITKNGNRLLVEICVTHKVDNEKKAKIKKLGLNCVEIVFPKDIQMDKSVIRQILAEGKDLFTPWINQKEDYIQTMRAYNMHEFPFDETEYIKYHESEYHNPDRHWINYPFGEEIHSKKEQNPIDEYSRTHPEEHMVFYDPDEAICTSLRYTLDDFIKEFETIKKDYKDRIFEWAKPVLDLPADYLAYHPFKFYGQDSNSVYINNQRYFLYSKGFTKREIWLSKSTWGFFKKLQENSHKLKHGSFNRYCDSCPYCKAKFVRDERMVIFCSLPKE